MSEFYFPGYADWLPIATELQKTARDENWPSLKERPRNYLISQQNFVTINGIISGPLSLPAHRDYYREVRASMVCAGFLHALAPVFGGGIAFLLSMAETTYHLPTRRMGLELLYVFSASNVYNALDLDKYVANWASKQITINNIPSLESDHNEVIPLVEDCVEIILRWWESQFPPLSRWLEETSIIS